MGYFNVTGAYRDTGKECETQILASNQEDAERQAAEMGILVSDIYQSISAQHTTRKTPYDSPKKNPPTSPFRVFSIVVGTVLMVSGLCQLAGYSILDLFSSQTPKNPSSLEIQEKGTNDLEKRVKELIIEDENEHPPTDGEYFVDDVQLVHSSENTYKGIAALTIIPKEGTPVHRNGTLEVTVDGNRIFWQMK